MKEKERIILFVKPGIKVGLHHNHVDNASQYSLEMATVQGRYIIATREDDEYDPRYNYRTIAEEKLLDRPYNFAKDWVEELNQKHLQSIGIENLIEYMLGGGKSKLVYSLGAQEFYWVTESSHPKIDTVVSLYELKFKYYAVYHTTFICDLFKLLRQEGD